MMVTVTCLAAYVAARHVAVANEGRSTTLLDEPRSRPGAPFAVLGGSDLDRYRQIMALQRAGRFGQADSLVHQLDDDILMGHVLAERYLHPKAYKSSFEELSAWLKRYPELPQAHRIYRLAWARRPKGAEAPTEPVGGYLGGAGQELKEECFTDAFLRRWTLAIGSWRRADYGTAANQFLALANDPGGQAEEVSAAAFWAARSQLRARRPEAVAGLLRRAAHASDGFYGLLAQRLLDENITFDWQREEFREEMAGLLLRYPAAKRAIALGQIGETDLAEAEVRSLAGRTAVAQDTQALTALAAALELPSAQMRLAQQLRLADGRRHDGAMFPIPRWSPQTGFRLDRTLVYAIVRAESAFDIEAESPRGALGLMQILPDTGAIVAKGAKLAYAGPDDLFQPETNLEIGQTWLRRLMRTDTVGNSLVHLILAYNSGENRVRGWLDHDLKTAKQDPLLFIESVPVAESRNYVKKVLANMWAYQVRLGERTPSLQALAENRWPAIGDLDTAATAQSPYMQVVAMRPVPQAAAAPAPARPSVVKAGATPHRAPAHKAVPAKRTAARGGSLGTLKVHARAP